MASQPARSWFYLHVFREGNEAVLCVIPLPGSYVAFFEPLVSPRHQGADKKPSPGKLSIPFPHSPTPTEMFCKDTFVAQTETGNHPGHHYSPHTLKGTQPNLSLLLAHETSSLLSVTTLFFLLQDSDQLLLPMLSFNYHC